MNLGAVCRRWALILVHSRETITFTPPKSEWAKVTELWQFPSVVLEAPASSTHSDLAPLRPVYHQTLIAVPADTMIAGKGIVNISNHTSQLDNPEFPVSTRARLHCYYTAGHLLRCRLYAK